MATPLDIGMLRHLEIIFPILLIFIMVYAILLRTEFFKSNKGLASLLGILLAIMTMFSPIAKETISMMAPWFVLLFLFAIFMIIAFMVFGVKLESITGVFTGGEYKFVVYWVIALVLIIMLGSLTTVISQRGGIGNVPTGAAAEESAAGDMSVQESQFWNTIVDPKILGLALILMIASFTVRFLSSET